MKVALMTPIRTGMVHHEFANSLAATWRAIKQMEVGWFTTIGNSILPDARSMCVAQALAWGADKLIFVDDDISWSVADFCFLSSHPVDACTGYYATRKTQDDQRTTITIQFLDDNRRADARGLIKVKGAGFGFIRFNREIFEAMRPDCEKLYDGALSPKVNEHFRDWFPYGYAGEGDKRSRAGEDVNFCHRMAEKGFDLWLDPAISLGHHAGADCYRANILQAA